VQTLQSRIIKIGTTTKINITQLPQTVSFETITVTQLKAGLAEGNIELIDIRGSEEHEDFNIGGRHIPSYKLERSMAQLDHTKTVVLYCTIGKRSADAVQQLKKTNPGLNVCSLEGGVKAWVEQE
jgi:rhodanese-related sulfurtransferase